jgi:BASS family bile acid:Na+ symporter
LVVNFLAVPVLCAVAARLAGLKAHEATAMVLLGAAPFAPVVPVFARMARADLPLAAALTSIYPVISAVATPWICGVLLKRASHMQGLAFSSGYVMMVLVATITLPMLLGIALNHFAPSISKRLVRPLEVASEAAGALSLAFVFLVYFHSISGLSASSLLIMGAIFEVSLVGGYLLGHSKNSKRVIALGTSNRNIALAILVALQGFPGMQVVSAVVGYGLVLILLGLAHVGYWRFSDRFAEPAPPKHCGSSL